MRGVRIRGDAFTTFLPEYFNLSWDRIGGLFGCLKTGLVGFSPAGGSVAPAGGTSGTLEGDCSSTGWFEAGLSSAVRRGLSTVEVCRVSDVHVISI